VLHLSNHLAHRLLLFPDTQFRIPINTRQVYILTNLKNHFGSSCATASDRMARLHKTFASFSFIFIHPSHRLALLLPPFPGAHFRIPINTCPGRILTNFKNHFGSFCVTTPKSHRSTT
jgi:hypothetical protein